MIRTFSAIDDPEVRQQHRRQTRQEIADKARACSLFWVVALLLTSCGIFLDESNTGPARVVRVDAARHLVELSYARDGDTFARSSMPTTPRNTHREIG